MMTKDPGLSGGRSAPFRYATPTSTYCDDSRRCRHPCSCRRPVRRVTRRCGRLCPGWSDGGGGTCRQVLTYNGSQPGDAVALRGTVQTLVVPSGVTSLSVVASGAAGASSASASFDGSPGGLGGRESATVHSGTRRHPLGDRGRARGERPPGTGAGVAGHRPRWRDRHHRSLRRWGDDSVGPGRVRRRWQLRVRRSPQPGRPDRGGQPAGGRRRWWWRWVRLQHRRQLRDPVCHRQEPRRPRRGCVRHRRAVGGHAARLPTRVQRTCWRRARCDRGRRRSRGAFDDLGWLRLRPG